MRRLTALPEVVSATATNSAPFSNSGGTSRFQIPGRTLDRDPNANRHIVTDRYFETLGIQVVKGRGFDARDAPGGHSAVVTDEFERVLMEGDALGKRFVLNSCTASLRAVGGGAMNTSLSFVTLETMAAMTAPRQSDRRKFSRSGSRKGLAMSKSGDDSLRSAWAKQTDQSLDVELANAEANVRRHRAEIARRDRIVYLSAAIIGPSWVAAIWFRPDLRLVSATGLFIALWVTWQMYRRSAARLSGACVDLPCLVFQRALLERERDLAKSLPKWFLVPVAVGQVVIVATLATNPRFTATQFFPEGLVLFVGTASVVLIVVWRRWQRQALELQREIEAIGVASEWNSSLKELR